MWISRICPVKERADPVCRLLRAQMLRISFGKTDQTVTRVGLGGEGVFAPTAGPRRPRPLFGRHWGRGLPILTRPGLTPGAKSTMGPYGRPSPRSGRRFFKPANPPAGKKKGSGRICGKPFPIWGLPIWIYGRSTMSAPKTISSPSKGPAGHWRPFWRPRPGADPFHRGHRPS